MLRELIPFLVLHLAQAGELVDSLVQTLAQFVFAEFATVQQQ